MALDYNSTTWANDQSVARRLLEKMGWKPGKGLGTKEDGSINNIEVNIKNDKLGIGVEPTSNNWIQSTIEFDIALAKLVPFTLQENESSNISQSPNNKTTLTTEEEEEAVRKKRRKEENDDKGEGKEKQPQSTTNLPNNKRTYTLQTFVPASTPLPSTTETLSSSSIPSSSSSSPLLPSSSQLPPPSSQKSHKHFIPRRVRRGKEVSNYSKDDLSAIFGFKSSDIAKKKAEEEQKKEVGNEEEKGKCIQTETISQLSISEYFAQQKQTQQRDGRKRKRSEGAVD